MQGGINNLVYPELSYKIVGVLYEVYNNLGFGYKEKIYQRAIEKELETLGIKYYSQAPYIIKYKKEIIGKRYLDFLIEDKIILEIKKGDYYARQNYQQVMEYLRVTNLKLAILSNFTSSGIKYKRIVNTKKR